jgi:branched-chain amino acid transport system substrate-binding protein
MKKETRRLFGALLMILLSLFLVIACAPSEAIPTGEKVVRIGAIPCLTGGGGTADQPNFRAFQDYVKYFNEQKGIPGVTVELVWRDNQTNIAAFISAYRTLVDRGIPIMFSNYPTPLEGLKAQLEKDHVPFVTGGATGPLIAPPGWIFAVWGSQGEAATVLLDYFMENWNKERAPRLQLFVLDEAYGRRPAEEIAPWAEDKGFEVLPLEVCPHVVIDATTQLVRIKERQADLVYIQTIISGGGPIMRDVERLGLQNEMQFAGTEWICGDRLIGFSPHGTEGFLSPKALPWFDNTEIPGVRTLVEKEREYHGEVLRVPELLSGWVYGAIVCEAARKAVEDVGVENVDGIAMKNALESMQDFDVDGIVKITFGPGDRRGNTSLAVYRIENGKIVRITDYREAHILVS